ncbi:hypothetical protein B0H16DRAFT_1476109 [Mycena metata]|uniref:Uncharacterized protein n=1 Tax=Mycena metata TaxID=1033252 RepID=A0AAD7HD97_9AGAR|nr:hypothetical protein B0H16DRAFT_1476109 [Mycena metata]
MFSFARQIIRVGPRLRLASNFTHSIQTSSPTFPASIPHHAPSSVGYTWNRNQKQIKMIPIFRPQRAVTSTANGIRLQTWASRILRWNENVSAAGFWQWMRVLGATRPKFGIVVIFSRLVMSRARPRPSGRAEPGPGLVKPSRARHKAWAGSGLGLEKCQARQASQARAWIYMAKSVPMAASVPSNAELYNANLSLGSSPLL